MWIILRALQKNLSWSIPIFMLAGFGLGIILENPAPLKVLILPFTFLMVYPMMVTMQFKKILEGGDIKVQIFTQFINFGIIPFLAFFLGKIFFSHNPYLALGFLLLSLLPTSGMTISWTGMSKGNMEAAVKMTVFGLIIGSLATPLYIKFLMGSTITIPITSIIIQIAVVVIIPMILGFFTQQQIISRVGMPRFQKDIKKKFPPLSTLGVLAIVFLAMTLKAKSIMSDPKGFLDLVPPLLILYLVNVFISTIIAKKFFNRGDGLALVYGTVLRNLSIALAIAMTSFGKEGSVIALIIALGYIVQIQISSLYVKFSSKIFGEPEEDRAQELMHEGVFALHVGDDLDQAIKLLAEEHIYTIAVVDEKNHPVGMLDSDTVLDALADEFPQNTKLKFLKLSPVVTIKPDASIQDILSKMKRNHEYKVLILTKEGTPSHVVTREDVLESISGRKH